MAWPKDVTKKDLRIERIRGSGAGGQKRNKTSSAVRITHIPTGLVGYSEDERSQHQNQKTAFRRLADKLVPLIKQETVRERYAAGHERVRSYHEPDQRVTDSRVPGRQWRYDDVIEGGALSEIIREVKLAKQDDG